MLAARIGRRDGWALLSLLASASALVLWVVLQPPTADLAAQVYRADLFRRAGWILWDNNWFGGHGVPGYSLLSPWLMALVGVGAAGAAGAAVSVVSFASIVRRLRPGAWVWPTAWVAWASVGDLLIGRVTYSLGIALGLLAVAVLVRGGPATASVVLAALSAATSPVAGLFAALALVVWASVQPRRDVLVSTGAALVVAVVVAVIFGDGGSQPYALSGAALAAGIALALRACVVPEATLARRMLLVYAVVVAASFALPTPMGSNVARLGVSFAVPLVLATRRRVPLAALVAVIAAAAAWLCFAPATEIAKGVGAPETQRAYYRPLMRELARRGVGATGRVEVVPSATRWESVWVGGRFPLARGWETQLDRARNPLFYAPRLRATAYVRWLRDNAVSYVALSRAPKERWGVAEQALLRRGVAGLDVVWRSRDWQLLRVRGTRPLAEGATLRRLGADRVVLDVPAPGTVSLRVRWSAWWDAGPAACVVRRPDGFTDVEVRRAGRLVLTSTPLGARRGCR